MQSLALLVLTLLPAALATWEGNLNYDSPSRRHPSLGIDVPKVAKRGLEAQKRATWDPSQLNFTHGVASGDPYPESVILWTRISPSMANDKSNITVSGYAPLYNHDTEKYIKADPNPICVEYRISPDKNFTTVADKGTAYTTSDIDYTVKVEAKNLKPFTTYYYQFNVCGSTKTSPLGRTKTSPTADDEVSKIGLAVYSCSDYKNGYFTAYGNSARKDNVDFVIHLGDYIYETGKGTLGKDPRATNPPGTLHTLYDYRTRIAQIRTDLDLSLSHQKFPWIPVWDDHEVSNNGYRDGSSALNNTEGSFIKNGRVSVDQRKMNAVRAYFEWMPIRQVDMDDNLRIWRNFSMGKLFDLIMLDTRNYDRSITVLDDNDAYIHMIFNDAGRTMMGGRQENWFYNQLSKSKDRGAKWRVIGNQILFSHVVSAKGVFSGEGWSGYQANRNRTFQHLYENKIDNNIMLAGDSHQNWVSDLVWLDNQDYDPATGVGSIGVEFAGTAVTSGKAGGGIAKGNAGSLTQVKNNRELQWQEGYYRGYYELQISPEEVKASYFGSPTVATRNPFEVSLANFTVKAGENHLARPVAGGVVEAGALQTGTVKGTNMTLNTETGTWNVTGFEQMFISYDSKKRDVYEEELEERDWFWDGVL